MSKGNPKTPRTAPVAGLQRVQLDIEPDRLDDMARLMQITSLRSRRELLDHALSLFEWAIEEAQRGNAIAALDVATNTFQRIEMPSLRAARRNAIRADHASATSDRAHDRKRALAPPAG